MAATTPYSSLQPDSVYRPNTASSPSHPPSPNTANSFTFSTQFRKGESLQALVLCSSSNTDNDNDSIRTRSGLTSDYPYPPTSLDQQPATSSADFTHQSIAACLRSLSPSSHQPIDAQKGLTSADVPSIRSRLPWTTHSTDHAGHRRAVQGYNEFAASEPESAWSKVSDQLKEPLILLLLASAVVSLLLGETDDAISIAIAVAIVVGGEWAYWVETIAGYRGPYRAARYRPSPQCSRFRPGAKIRGITGIAQQIGTALLPSRPRRVYLSRPGQ